MIAHNPKAQKFFDGYIDSVNAGIFARTLTEEANAKRFADDLQSGDPAKLKKCIAHMEKSMRVVRDMEAGRRNDVWVRHKNTSGDLLGPMMPQTVVAFENMFDEGQLDQIWRAVFAVDDLTRSSKGLITDIFNKVEWDNYAFGEAIRTTPYKATAWSTIEPERFGGGVSFDRNLLIKDPMASINLAIAASRFASESNRAAEAYLFINAAIVLANAAGYVTSFVTSDLPQTLNNASVTLTQRNQNRGYAVTAQTPKVLLANEIHRSVIEAAFRQTNSEDFGTLRVQYPISRGYTFNLAADLDLGGVAKAILILPARRNRQGNFKALQFETEQVIKTNLEDVVGQEEFEFQTDELQYQIVELA